MPQQRLAHNNGAAKSTLLLAEGQIGSAPTNVAGRTLEVLSAFDGPRNVLGVSEIAMRAGVPKSTAHRLLSVMAQRGFVRREGNRYRLGERLFELGSRAVEPRGLRDRAVPFMIELHHATRETVHLAVLHGDQVLYIEKIYGHGTQPCPTAIGSSNPATCTALGKAMLAHSAEETVARVLGARLRRLTPRSLCTPDSVLRSLNAAREDQVAVEYEECRLGLGCVAAPIVDVRSGLAVAALSISAPTSHVNRRRFAELLTKAANNLSRVPTANLRYGQTAPR